MNDNALKFASYWRNCLVDAEQSHGALRLADRKTFITLSGDDLRSGHVEKQFVDTLFAGESLQVHTVDVIVRPWIFRALLEHGKARTYSVPAIVTPIVANALINRHGQLFPTSKTLIPRDLLEPLEASSFALGSVKEADVFLTENPVPHFEPPEDGSKADEDWYSERWTHYLEFCQRFLAAVGRGWPRTEDHFLLCNEWYLFKEQRLDGASQHIVRLYDHIRAVNPSVPLFERYTDQEPQLVEPCFPANAGFTARLGHASDIHSLATAQRDALTHVLAGVDSDILAVNGPPGTGKTTLLLSVVASLWAKAALAGGEPPVLVASSTNNQAVTNIIDAFGKDFSSGQGEFSGRWLPDIESFGAYLPSSSKETAVAMSYQTRSFFEMLETEAYLVKAKDAYLTKAAAAFPEAKELTIKVAVDRLQNAIRARAATLNAIEEAWQTLVKSREALEAELGSEPQARLEERHQAVLCQESRHRSVDFLCHTLEQYLADESILYALFSWLPAVASKRLRLAKLHLRQRLSSGENRGLQLTDSELNSLDAWNSVAKIETGLVKWKTQSSDLLREKKRSLQHGERLLADEQRCLANWNLVLESLSFPSDRATQDISLTDCDVLADTQIRFPIFLLTTHYWEGRWLLEMEESLKDVLESSKKNGRKTLERRWRRWMKLTPCVVSTFFMLPKEMRGSKYDGNGHVDDYMYNFVDLLIVDEAGQVLPEVAGASFALGKQSLVIGDTLQIEPIWSVPVSIDIGNLANAGLLPSNDIAQPYERLCSTGKSSASGSVMQIAQHASRYHYDADMERGMFLYEHRRCFDSIIDYCNRLCYQGKLQPKRGLKPGDGLPGLGYLHIDGLCQHANGGSRHNLPEAKTVAAWLESNRTRLEDLYKKDLAEIVGVITPFGAQVQAIADACTELGIRTGKGKGELTIGTVHSFQGAERLVVIFSSVYSKHADGGFIDRRDSMLNVAVSRAKDSFLVFGDMDVWGAISPARPRGLLAEYLHRDSDAQLQFEYQARIDLHTARTGLQHLHDAGEHDSFLLQTLQDALREVHIVTPWISLDRIKEIGAWDAMICAVTRGVRVVVYTDIALNQNRQARKSSAAMGTSDLKKAIDALRALGIEAHLLNKVHSKIVMVDDDLLCIGSFNWFSASRSGEYVRLETSMVYRGPDVLNEIEVNRRSLANRILPVRDL